MEFRQSSKLSEVCYEIRGPVIEQADALEAAGHSVLRLNTGNPALFGFEAPEEILQDMIRMLPQAHGYTDSRGVLSARRAVAQRYQDAGPGGRRRRRLPRQRRLRADLDGRPGAASRTATRSSSRPPTSRSGRPSPPSPAARRCTTSATRQADWYPDLDDMASKITDRTKAVVIINPNNPTGAVYSEGDPRGHPRPRPPARPDGLRRRDLRPDPVRRRRAPLGRRARPRPGRPDLLRPVEDLPGGRFPVRLAGGHRSETARPRTTWRA